MDGELWHTQRRLASHEFTARSLKDFVKQTLEEEVNERLLPVLESLSIGNKVVDLQDLLGRFSFNVICKFTLGVNRSCLDPCAPVSPLARAFDVASEISARRGAAPVFFIWKMKRWLGVGSEQKLKEAVKAVQSNVMEMIHERKKNMKAREENEDLLSRLISSGQEEEVIRDMVISFIMAGRDTTSAAMTWFFWLISHYPALENQIVKEAQEKAERGLNYKSLKNFKFLKACLCESMRLYPPVAWDSKHAIADDLLPDGTKVKAGDRVTYFPYGMGRMEALWGNDWFEFRPDRWLIKPDTINNKSKISPFKFPTFQAGPRICLGKDMAFIQMKYVVASILRNFKIIPVSEDKPLFVPRLTAHMAGGLKVLVCKREKLT